MMGANNFIQAIYIESKKMGPQILLDITPRVRSINKKENKKYPHPQCNESSSFSTKLLK